MERAFEAEFIHRIHSSFAFTSVQSDSFPSAISIVHFAVRTAGADPEPAGLAVEAQIASINPTQVSEGKIA